VLIRKEGTKTRPSSRAPPAVRVSEETVISQSYAIPTGSHVHRPLAIFCSIGTPQLLSRTFNTSGTIESRTFEALII
jgi:hypothetical protein